jgi:antitoxin MazE
MQSQIGKWGNSLALRIPGAIAREAALGEGNTVDITVRRGSIVIRPIRERPRLELDDLLSKISDENLHAETTTGPAVGDEFP